LDGETPDVYEVELTLKWGMDDEYCWAELESGSRLLTVFHESDVKVPEAVDDLKEEGGQE
jgi:hypothetical protein